MADNTTVLGNMAEQPERLRYVFDNCDVFTRPFVEVIKKNNIKKVLFFGSGTSYNVSVLEFIDMTHSPKNILIRAIRNDKMSLDKRNKALEEVEEVLDIFKISSTLYKLLIK